MPVPKVAAALLLLLAGCWCFCVLPCGCIQFPVQEGSVREKQISRVQRSLQSAPNIIFVSLLNGKMVAVDSDSGNSLWTFDTGSPLISSKKGEPMEADIVLDGTDGGLYTYRNVPGLEPGLERLAITLPELVEAAPSLTEDGSLLLGTRRSTVYLLDTATGQLLSTFSDSQGTLEDRSATGINERIAAGTLLVVGRQDFAIRSQRVATGQDAWNATFSRLHLLNLASPDSPPLGARSPALDAFFHGDAPLDAAGGSHAAARRPGGAPPGAAPPPRRALPRLAVGMDNSLQAYDPTGRDKRWSILFDAAPVGAFSAATGSVNFLKAPPPPPEGRLDVSARPPEAPAAISGPTVVVGRLSDGSAYALKADHLALDSATLTPLPPPTQSPDPSLDAAPPPPTANNTPPRTPPRSTPSSQPSLQKYFERLDGHDPISNLICPAGVHPVVTHAPSHPSFIPPPSAASRRAAAAAASRRANTVAAAPALDPELLAQHYRFRLQVLYACGAFVGLVGLLWILWVLVNRFVPPPAPPPSHSPDLVAAAAAILAHHKSLLTHNSWAVDQFNNADPAYFPAGRPYPRALSDPPSDPPTLSPHASLTRLPSDPSQSQISDHGLPSPAPSNLAPSLSPTPHIPPSNGALMNPPLPAVLRRQVDADGAVLVGRLRIGPSVLGYGSAGTVVYEGRLDGRPVAVKRMLRQFYEIARKEIGLLIVSDEHPNVVRCFAMEEDEEFVYMALERCRSSLSDLVTAEGRTTFLTREGRPSRTCEVIMLDIASGLGALHERGIVHRDLKPHNVLLTSNGRAKLSDMGLSKQLGDQQSSFESHGAGGSSGWQAPEQLMAKGGSIGGGAGGGAPRQTRAMDVFSLGCVLYYCITGGQHPYGETYERDTNILHGAPNLIPLQSHPEAANLIATMLRKDAAARPAMTAVLAHPLWWSPERRLQFLLDISDRVEGEDREPDQTLLDALESWRFAAIGTNWGSAMDPELIANVGRYRRYDYTSLRDLLRVVRNKRSHFREMPEALQEKMGPIPEGYLAFFCSRFPRLLLAVFFFAMERLHADPSLSRYWASDPAAFDPCRLIFQSQAAALAAAAPARGRAAQRTAVAAAPPAPAAEPAAAKDAAAGEQAPVSRKDSQEQPTSADSTDAAAAAAAVASDGSVPVVGWEVVEDELPELQFKEFPKRAGKQLCDFFMKTGHCKYGEECIFDHPEQYAVGLTLLGFPYRPGNQLCTFYLKNSHCKFGPACKFHHPPLRAILAGSSNGPDGLADGAAEPAGSSS